MSLAEKYGIEEDKIKKLIRDGWLSCEVPHYEQVYNVYRSERSKGTPVSQAVSNTAEVCRMSDRMVYIIIKKF